MAAAVGSGRENGRRSAGVAGLRARLKPIAQEYAGGSPVAGDDTANQLASPIAESAL
jgi:hypothetical protein